MASSGCDQLRDALDLQLPSLFLTKSFDDECRVATPFTLPDGQLVSVWVGSAKEATFAVRDDGLAGNALYLGGIGQRVITARLKASAVRYALDLPIEDQLATHVAEADLTRGIVAVANAVVDASAILLAPQTRKTTKDFHSTVERFFVRNGWRYQPTRLVQGRSRQRRIDFTIGDGPRQLMLLTFQPGDERAAEIRLDEITVTTSELAGLDRTQDSNLAVFVDDRSEAMTPIATAWMKTLNDLLPGRVVLWHDRTRIGSLVGQQVPALA